jgi:glutamyl-tRNA reductase
MKLTPDNFPVVNDRELRELWQQYPDENVRRLILEVHRAREVIRDVHSDALAAQNAIRNKEDGNLKANLQKVIDRALNEKIRLGAMGGITPKT